MSDKSFWSTRQVLLALLIIVVSPRSLSLDMENTELVISAHTLGTFFRVAECLSIRVPNADKRFFLTSRLMLLEWNVESGERPPQEWFRKLDEAEKLDIDEIYTAIEQYCPLSGRAAGKAITTNVPEGSLQSTQVDILIHLIVKVISSDVLDKKTRIKIFSDDHKGIGLSEMY